MYVFVLCPPGTVKAFFLRGKAHVEVWNEAEARQDFSKVLDLDPGMKKAVKKELAVLNMRMEEKNQEDKDKYKGMFWWGETEDRGSEDQRGRVELFKMIHVTFLH